MATRREFLAGAAGWAISAAVGDASTVSPLLVSAAHIGTADSGAVWQDGRLAPFAIRARGHGLASTASGRVILMGRRPGLFSSIVDPNDLAAPARFFAPARGCRFSGHAAISNDGKSLVTGEFDAETYEAAIVTRNPTTGEERSRWNVGGIEPHDLTYACGGECLIVALGGLVNDGGVAAPAFNPEGVRSEVLEIDPRSGAVIVRHRMPASLASVSLRHLAVRPGGQAVAVAGQDQDLSERRPLVGLLTPGCKIELLPMPDPRQFDLRGYVGSIAFDRSGEFIAAASPRGSLVGLWSASRRAWLGGLAIADVCGIAAGRSDATFWATSGHGGIYKIAADAHGAHSARQWRADAGFDNHLLVI
jgi:hypothetical protein